MLRKACLALICSVALVSLTACGGAEVKSEITTTTKGQQLLDLKHAFDAGAMTKDEYERERLKVINAK